MCSDTGGFEEDDALDARQVSLYEPLVLAGALDVGRQNACVFLLRYFLVRGAVQLLEIEVPTKNREVGSCLDICIARVMEAPRSSIDPTSVS